MQTQPVSQPRRPSEMPKMPEAPKAPERSIAEVARDIQKQGDQRAAEASDDIDAAWDFVTTQEEPDPVSQTRLKSLKQEVVQAKTELNTALFGISDELDEGWDEVKVEEETESMKAAFQALEAKIASVADPDEKMSLVFDEMEECFKNEASMDTVAALLKIAKAEPKYKSKVEESVTGWVGKKVAERLLSDPEYLKSLTKISNKVGGRYGGDAGPRFIKEHNLSNLVAVKEALGEDPELLVRAIDLSQDSAELTINNANDFPVIDILRASPHPDTGELEVDLNFGLEFKGPVEKDEYGNENETFAQITRDLHRKAVPTKEGGQRMQTVVKHDIFQLPNSIKAGGMAARIQRDCLKEYDKMGVEEISLYASLDMGGYCWASYGYGWDEKQIAGNTYTINQVASEMAKVDENKIVEEIRLANPSLSPKDLAKKREEKLAALRGAATQKAAEAFAQMSDVERLPHLNAGITRIAKKCQETAIEALKQAGLVSIDGKTVDPSVEGVLKRFEEALKTPEIITPQFIASLGKEGPFLKRGVSGWYTEEAYEKAIANGDDKPDPNLDPTKPIHFGQAALMGNSWHGKMELTKDGKQGGKNREILDKKLRDWEQKRLAKKAAN